MMGDVLIAIWLLVIISSSVMVGFTSGRIVELKRTERLLREVADEMVNPMPVTLVEGEEDDEP